MSEKIGLLATSRRKGDEEAPVVEFYKSPLFIKALQYAHKNYDRFYFYNAKDGLLLPDQMMAPYDVSIQTFSISQKRHWGKKVIESFSTYEIVKDKIIYLHGGRVYRQFLEPELSKHGFYYEVPLKGLGIGKQLKWYENELNK
ncbi:hypothetical protein EV207_11982 [Scopulibacillus darangshiensis]|uniref:DUF6884 domain-containing protein n=1 Tax=Scopulibacillus darangshiensis TaxID=442528 RepID=A0A4R2NWT6_9BACL|nr:DUF6884 domain-containing protein [Scopulibacillus darangshiensis]TCP26649.1 hypothetical protein EV207_11982 [Scopulibacillus darangshiensis]